MHTDLVQIVQRREYRDAAEARYARQQHKAQQRRDGAAFEHAVKGAQHILVGARNRHSRFAFAQVLHKRLVVFVNQHHHWLLAAAVERFDQFTKLLD